MSGIIAEPGAEPGAARCGAAIRTLSTLVLALSIVFSTANAVAVEVTSLYTAQAPLGANGSGSRDDTYAQALSQVLTRICGTPDALDPAEVKTLFPDPAHYVLQYRPGEDNTLWVTFDGNAIERVLEQANLSVWGSDRPLTLVWLAVDRGQGEREIVAADDPDSSGAEERSIDRNRFLRERIQEAAERRGIPIAFPLLDARDLENVSFSDIWGGFGDRLRQASRRYDAESVLVGRVSSGAIDRDRWSYYFGDEQREWTGEPEEVIGKLADTLTSEFAIAGNDRPETFTLTVSGVDSVEAYGAVQSYMEKLDLIDELTIDSVSLDRIRYRIKMRGGKDRLRRVLEYSSLLKPVEPVDNFDRSVPAARNSEPDAFQFSYRH